MDRSGHTPVRPGLWAGGIAGVDVSSPPRRWTYPLGASNPVDGTPRFPSCRIEHVSSDVSDCPVCKPHKDEREPKLLRLKGLKAPRRLASVADRD